MARYILKRLILIIPILIAVSIAVFLLLSLSPNDPALLILGANASEADLEMFREQHGLNLPLVTQYLNYMSGLLQGDMGTSYKTMQDVSLMIGIRIWNTLILCAGACLLITILGVILGIAMALRQNSFFNNVMRVIVLIFSAMPQARRNILRARFWRRLRSALCFLKSNCRFCQRIRAGLLP